MPDDYYSDSSSEDNPGPKKEGKEPREKTALLPKSFFPDSPEPGKICKVRVVEVYEDEALVEYVHEGKKSEPKRESRSAPDDMEDTYS